ncbi:hypothetical protein L1887_57727 [Cichorium endivia]|nr:hypothetical protein L1887_57727 [Cichorium endivia]
MHQFEHSAAGHASSSRTPAMPRISTALAFPPSSTSSSSPDTAGSASLASPATSTPRATSPENKPSESTKHDAPPHSPVPACMAGLALQVQSAVSRNVTGPLVQVLTDAQEASALHCAQHDAIRTLSTEASASRSSSSSSSSSSSGSGSGSSASSRTAPMPGQTSAASRYVSALSSPDLVPCDAAAQSSAQALMGTSAQDSDDLATQLHSVHAADAAHTSSSPVVAPLLQQRDSGSSDGSGSGTEASLAQSDICRTPSTSTTGSSHAGSLDTAISSVPSGTEFESNYKSHVEEQSADTLRVSVAAYDPSIAPSQASPISLSSEADNALLDYSPLPHDASAGASLVEAKSATAKVRRYAALLELIDTERNYADDLATLVLVFFDNLCMMPFFNDQPARQALVMRNSQDLLRTHQKLSAKLDAILVDLGLRKSGQRHADDQKTELEKALSPQADEAVVRAAKLFNQMMPQLQSYKAFCSRHGEALALIREAEKRHADWDAFERHCADILRLTQRAHKHTSSPPTLGCDHAQRLGHQQPGVVFYPHRLVLRNALAQPRLGLHLDPHRRHHRLRLQPGQRRCHARHGAKRHAPEFVAPALSRFPHQAHPAPVLIPARSADAAEAQLRHGRLGG